MMNANRLSSGKALYGQALFVGSARSFSSFRPPVQLSESCLKQQEIIPFGPQCSITGLQANFVFTGPSFVNKRMKKDSTAAEDCPPKHPESNRKANNRSHQSIEKLEDLCIAEMESKKNQHCRKKKNNNMRKKWKKKRRCGAPKEPENASVPTRQISECDDSFVIEFQCPEAADVKNAAKKVRFADNKNLCQVHVMNRWDFAYRAARKGPWEEMARDRDRFSKRIREAEVQLSSALNAKHREHIFNERFRYE